MLSFYFGVLVLPALFLKLLLLEYSHSCQKLVVVYLPYLTLHCIGILSEKLPREFNSGPKSLVRHICIPKKYTWFAVYSALPIFRGPFSPHNSPKTPIAHPLGRCMGVFREFEVWPKYMYYLWGCCAVVLFAISCYIVPRYMESL